MSSREPKAKKAKKPGRVETAKLIYAQALIESGLSPELIEKARVELVREKIVTPFRVAQKYGIQISAARKLIETLAGEGLLAFLSGNRRTRLYAPVKG